MWSAIKILTKCNDCFRWVICHQHSDWENKLKFLTQIGREWVIENYDGIRTAADIYFKDWVIIECESWFKFNIISLCGKSIYILFLFFFLLNLLYHIKVYRRKIGTILRYSKRNGRTAILNRIEITNYFATIRKKGDKQFDDLN